MSDTSSNNSSSISSSSVCTICLEALVRHEESMCATVPCGHAFHADCIKTWTQRKLNSNKDNNDNDNKSIILCPVCNTTVTNVMKIYLSSKGGNIDTSLTGKELECWKKEYDDVTKGHRLQLHADVLNSNKRIIDEIFQKQKIMETYEANRLQLDHAKDENLQLRKELFKQIMKYESEMRRMESNKQIITEILERNEKALYDLKATREENLDLKKELLRNIMVHQNDMKKLEESKKAMTKLLEKHETVLLSLKESREENLCLKKELVDHLQKHQLEMKRLDSHKEALNDIIKRHDQNVQELDMLRKENLELKEELIEALIKQKSDKSKLEKAREWLDFYQEEVQEYRQDHKELKRIRNENYRLSQAFKDKHHALIQMEQNICYAKHSWIETKLHCVIVLGQIGLLGVTIFGIPTTSRQR